MTLFVNYSAFLHNSLRSLFFFFLLLLSLVNELLDEVVLHIYVYIVVCVSEWVLGETETEGRWTEMDVNRREWRNLERRERVNASARLKGNTAIEVHDYLTWDSCESTDITSTAGYNADTSTLL